MARADLAEEGRPQEAAKGLAEARGAQEEGTVARGCGRAAWRGFLLGLASGVALGAWFWREAQDRWAGPAHGALDTAEDWMKRAIARGRAWVGPRPLGGPPHRG